jgi:alkylation response protein AidB-like acyl-CoA dehydrogenase
MNFAATEEQVQLGESLQRLLAGANDFESRRKRLRQEKPDRLALWPQFAELGLIAAAFDEAHSGFAGDARTVAVVLSALGESLAVEPYLASAVMAGRILQRSTSAVAARLIVECIAGQSICVLAHDAGTDPFGTPTVTRAGGDDGAALRGTIRCVRHADVATSFLVSAASHEGIHLYLVPRDAVGLTVAGYRLIDGAGGGDLILDSVQLPEAAELQFAANARAALDDALEWGLVGLSAEVAGIVGALNRATFSYLANRKQFGVPLATRCRRS